MQSRALFALPGGGGEIDPPPPPDLSTGKVIRFSPRPLDVFPTYVMEGGHRRHILNQDVYSQSGLSAAPVQTVRLNFSSIPAGPDLVGPEDGMLLTVQSRPPTSVVLGGTLRPLPDQATIDAVLQSRSEHNRLALTWIVPSTRFPIGATLVSLARGSSYLDSNDREGRDAYLSDGTYLRSLRDIDDFACLGISWPTQTCNVDDLAKLGLLNEPFPSCADGNVYSDGSSTFAMQGGQRHLIPDQATLNALGPSNIVSVPKPVLDFYIQGEPLAPIRIDHVVVLMLENRSFDHILGYLAAENPIIDGIRPGSNYSNPVDPTVVGSRPVPVTDHAKYITGVDPGHELANTNRELTPVKGDDGAGKPFRTTGMNNSGFVAEYAKVIAASSASGVAAESVMDCFAPAKLPALTALAREFAVCDAWFSSVPGPTMPNRFFAHAGTSAGYAKSPFDKTRPDLGSILADLIGKTTAGDPLTFLTALLGNPNKLEEYLLTILKARWITNDSEADLLLNRIDGSICELLERYRRTWAIYFHDMTEAFCIPWLRARFMDELRIPFDGEGFPTRLSTLMTGSGNFRTFDKFIADAAAGRLPFYSFIEPRFGHTPNLQAGFDVINAVLTRIMAEETSEIADLGGENPDVGFPDLIALARALTMLEPGNDCHPPNDVSEGDKLVARIYNAIRASPTWERTVFVVLFDEAGGFYDHVTPPAAPNPDRLHRVYNEQTPGFRKGFDPTFGFDVLGLRVPAIVVSPFIERSSVDHQVYDHTSLLYTVSSIAAVPGGQYNRLPPQPFTFARLLTRQSARQDTPTSISSVP